MGLDIAVYTNVVQMPDGMDYDFQAYVIDKEWKWKIKNLIDGGHYVGKREDVTLSYPCSSHGFFRIMLMDMLMDRKIDKDNWCKIIEANPQLPFAPFIDFADNEGCLDWEVSKQLYEDFATYWVTFFKTYTNEVWRENYHNWMKVFKIASEKNGVIRYG